MQVLILPHPIPMQLRLQHKLRRGHSRLRLFFGIILQHVSTQLGTRFFMIYMLDVCPLFLMETDDGVLKAGMLFQQ